MQFLEAKKCRSDVDRSDVIFKKGQSTLKEARVLNAPESALDLRAHDVETNGSAELHIDDPFCPAEYRTDIAVENVKEPTISSRHHRIGHLFY